MYIWGVQIEAGEAVYVGGVQTEAVDSCGCLGCSDRGRRQLCM